MCGRNYCAQTYTRKQRFFICFDSGADLGPWRKSPGLVRRRPNIIRDLFRDLVLPSLNIRQQALNELCASDQTFEVRNDVKISKDQPPTRLRSHFGPTSCRSEMNELHLLTEPVERERALFSVVVVADMHSGGEYESVRRSHTGLGMRNTFLPPAFQLARGPRLCLDKTTLYGLIQSRKHGPAHKG